LATQANFSMRDTSWPKDIFSQSISSRCVLRQRI